MDMRISSVYNAYSVQSGRRTTQATRAEKRSDSSDAVSVSAQAGDYQTARRAATNAPDIRESVVNRIQEMLDAGTYRVSAQEVAASIFRGL
ncbi:MAG: flagellar biosynthesis anti-sigma factor FlgM [Defluviitaleaceae bacterium]|nr:flagellar biosynthesis anti-sigma factor FlgM [Defluviitaleaceae bacterium]MCL2263985.1 flagellar biosynthesis anti-sigma factor FlgM [Defluviitaleaceae bacterium]